MPALYLVDTNTLSNLIRQTLGRVAEQIAQVGEASVLTSVVVACELRYGAAKRESRRLARQVEVVLGAVSAPFQPKLAVRDIRPSIWSMTLHWWTRPGPVGNDPLVRWILETVRLDPSMASERSELQRQR